MKIEAYAGALLVLLFAVSLLNIHFLGKLTDEIAELAERTGEFAREGDWDSALSTAEEAVERWENSDEYTHIVLRHSEIESAGESLSNLLKEVYSKNTGASQAAARSAALRIRSVASIERIKPGSIF